VKKKLSDVRVVFAGAGASGIATAKLLMAVGCRHIIGCDRSGTLYAGRTENMNSMKAWFAEHTNEKRLKGTIADALKGADVFVGLSGPGVVSAKDVRRMAKKAIVFAMANPVPEVMPEEVRGVVSVMATGRSDYPNQINNVLCFPGFFRGMLDVRARLVNDEMKIAAARGIASIIKPSELGAEYIIPSVFDKRVVEAVAEGVSTAATQTGVARRKR
jgi:malate dehydrogenase (oxaloacetate-decarboxylating)